MLLGTYDIIDNVAIKEVLEGALASAKPLLVCPGEIRFWSKEQNSIPLLVILEMSAAKILLLQHLQYRSEWRWISLYCQPPLTPTYSSDGEDASTFQKL